MSRCTPILILDDDATALEALASAVSWQGQALAWEVTATLDPEVALECFGAGDYRVLVSDLQVVRCQPTSWLLELKRAKMRVILLATATPDLEDLWLAEELQASLLAKPCPLLELLHGLHTALGTPVPMAAPVADLSSHTLMGSLQDMYGLHFKTASDAVEYLPLDRDRLGLLAMQSWEQSGSRGIAQQLRRRQLRERTQLLLQQECSPAHAIDALRRLAEEEQLEQLGLFVGVFDRSRKTFSHAQVGFRAPSLSRKELKKSVARSTIHLRPSDVLQLNCHEESLEDGLSEFLEITVRWGQSAQLDLPFGRERLTTPSLSVTSH